MSCNILITCAGRRSYLVDYFREVVAPLGGHVVTANSESFAAGLLAGDRRYVVPTIDDPGYLEALLRIVEDEEISLVLSLFDGDLPKLAAARQQFLDRGAEVAVSDPETIDMAGDKWRMFEFLTSRGVPTPRTWLDPDAALAAVAAADASFPLFVKPRWGMASLGVLKVHSPDQIHALFRHVRDEVTRRYRKLMAPEGLQETILVQESLLGQEYGADILNDFQGNHIATTIRRKIAMRAGETNAAVSVSDPELEELCSRLAHLLRHRGNADVDFIRPPGGAAQVLEINARFGGGYPFSHLAGARFPRALVQMVRGEAPDPGEVEPGVYALKDIVPRRYELERGYGGA